MDSLTIRFFYAEKQGRKRMAADGPGGSGVSGDKEAETGECCLSLNCERTESADPFVS